MFSLTNLINIYSSWLVALNNVWNVFNTSLTDLLPDDFFTIFGVLDSILQFIGIGNLTVLEFGFGIGLSLYIFYQFVSWLLNLVTKPQAFSLRS